MKFFLLLTWTCAALYTQKAIGSPPGRIHAPLDIISLEDITPEERKQIAYLEQKLGRPKRSGSGSGDILNALKTAIGQGIKRKVGQIAKASASASAHFSSSSSGKGGGGHSYLPPEHAHESYDDHKSFDFWTLKKSILNTLLQAVKAIKGGVIAVKGQLIKGSGKLISAKGKLISYKGDAITKLGKNIATSAILVPYNSHHPAGHGDYGSSDPHYSAPSGPEEIYDGSPSAPGPEYHDYHVPNNYPPPHHEGADGLLIVKKIPSGYHHQHVEDVPAFKPLKSSGPGFGTIVSKFFAASSSFDPHQPEPFGNTASAGTYHDSNEPESNYHYDDPWDNEVAPSAASGLVTLGEKYAISQQKPVPPTTSYGEPFEKAPSYLSQNLDDFSTAASQNNPKLIKSSKINPSTSVGTGKMNSQHSFVSPQESTFITLKNTSFDESLSPSHGFDSSLLDYSLVDQYSLNSEKVEQLQPTSDQVSFYNNMQTLTGNSNHASSGYLSSLKGSQLPNIADYPDGFPGHKDIKVEDDYFSLPRQDHTEKSLQQPIQSSSGLKMPLSSPSPYLQSPEIKQFSLPTVFNVPFSSPSPYLQSPKTKQFFLPTPNVPHDLPSPTKLSYFENPKYRYTSSKRPSIRSTYGLPQYIKSSKSNPGVKLIKSVSYELGPHGPKRLT